MKLKIMAARYPIRSMIRLKTMMLMAKGQMPAPNNSWPCTLSRPKSAGQKSGTLTRNARVMKAKAVVMRAMKHPQNIFMSGAESWLLMTICVFCSLFGRRLRLRLTAFVADGLRIASPKACMTSGVDEVFQERCCFLAQLSRSGTARLRTGFSDVESLGSWRK